MQYTIREINGSIVTVDYADGSWANIQIKSELTSDEIDQLVGTYTQVYEVAEAANPLLSVGDVRNTQPVPPPPAPPEPLDNYDIDLGTSNSTINDYTLLVVALYLQSQGDPCLINTLYAKAKEIVDDADFDSHAIENQINDTL